MIREGIRFGPQGKGQGILDLNVCVYVYGNGLRSKCLFFICILVARGIRGYT